uniref:Uncharacterized protein n=1 Tax=Wuchereria bancrofti TaxID=6293 RepID=A0AAF5Q5U5_WUCBA
MNPGRGEEFDALYAQERKERSEREQSRRKRYKRPNKQKLKDIKRVDAKSIRDVLRKRLKGKEINSLYQRQNDIASYQSDKVNRRSGRRNSQFRNYNYKSHRSRQLQSIKESPGSWLFKSAKKRKKEWLQQQLDLRRKENLLTAHQDVVSTAHAKDQSRSLLERIRKNGKSHQTARSIVEEDLKQRLQQMVDNDSRTQNDSSDASVRNLKRRRKLLSDQRISDKRSCTHKSKHSNKDDDRLSQGSEKIDSSSKYRSQSEKQVSDDYGTPGSSTSTAANSQKQSKNKLSEKKCSESEVTEKISARN